MHLCIYCVRKILILKSMKYFQLIIVQKLIKFICDMIDKRVNRDTYLNNKIDYGKLVQRV